jgi:hypothetical protein
VPLGVSCAQCPDMQYADERAHNVVVCPHDIGRAQLVRDRIGLLDRGAVVWVRLLQPQRKRRGVDGDASKELLQVSAPALAPCICFRFTSYCSRARFRSNSARCRGNRSGRGSDLTYATSSRSSSSSPGSPRPEAVSLMRTTATARCITAAPANARLL